MKNLKIFSTFKQKLAKNKLWQKRWVRWTTYTIGALFLLSILSVIAAYVLVAKDLPSVVNLDERRIAESSQIYDRTGEVLLYEISGNENRRIISSEEIPDTLKQAFIAIEDQAFYEHIGIRPRAIVRAAISNVTGQGIGGGASTITQQFVKNALLTNERSLIRKAREAILAIQIEQRYDKEEIITLYLNEIPFGGQTYGVQAAAQTFFGVNASELEPYQAAMMAAMIQRPTFFSPYGSNFEALVTRQQFVLRLMRDEGYLTQEEYEEQKDKELIVQPFARNIKAPHFVFYVREQLAEQFGEEVLEQGGLRIQTTLDWELQQIAETAVREGLEPNRARFDAQNAALGAINPENGDILAMVGSRNYFDTENDGNVNVLTSSQSPGSSIKPLVYASAFEKGFHPETYVFDLPTDFELTPGLPPYEPNNFNMQFNGPVSLRRALATSLNIPAVKTLYLAGITDTKRLGFELGISDYREDRQAGLAMALGGVDLRLIEHFGSYGAFANDGLYNPITGVMQVTNTRGETLYAWESNEKRVLTSQTARQVTNVLADNDARAPVFGFTNNLSVPGAEVAAKTGTSQQFRDALTVGYTTNLVAGVWVGKNDNSPMVNGADGSVVAAPIWNRFMREAVALRPGGSFTAPDSARVDKPMMDGGFERIQKVAVNRITGRRATDRTPPELIEEREYKTVHNLLHWVDREDPRGDIPSDPTQDPMYERWESGVRSWASGREEYSQRPPAESDDESNYSEANRPQVTISRPSNGATIDSRTVSLRVAVEAPQGVEQVDVYLNDESVFSSDESSFTRDITLKRDGSNTITVRAFDTFFNRGEAEVTFEVEFDEEAPEIRDFKVSGTPLTQFLLEARVTDSDGEVERVEFWDKLTNKRVGNQGNPTGDLYTYEYSPPPGATQFEFYVRAIDDSNNVSTSETIKFPS